MKKILILGANPRKTNSLRLDEEVREIKNALQLSRNRDNFHIITESAVQIGDLIGFLSSHQPTIVQFCGHDEGAEGLALENNSGQMQLVSALALARLFKLFPQIECVVLNACYSEVQAEAIHQHINYVIGINKAIGDKAAVRFSVGFYDALFSGRSYEDCFHMGSTSIDLQGIPEHSIPVIRIRQPLKEEKPTSTPIPSNQGNSKKNKVAIENNVGTSANILLNGDSKNSNINVNQNTSDSEIDDIVNDVDDKVNFSIPIINFVSTIFNGIVTSYTLSKNLRPGRIAFNAPRRMVLNRTKLIEVKITDDFNRELKIEAEKQEDIVSEKINIYDYMEAELTGINFEIKSLHKQKQIIPKGEITTWRWSVIPTRLGKQKLYLNIYARFQAGLSEESYNLRTFEYTIYVQVGLWDWVKANWVRLLIWLIPGGAITTYLFRLIIEYFNKQVSHQVPYFTHQFHVDFRIGTLPSVCRNILSKHRACVAFTSGERVCISFAILV